MSSRVKNTSCKKIRYSVSLFNPFTKKWTVCGKYCNLKDIGEAISRNYRQVRYIYEGKAKKDCDYIKINSITSPIKRIKKSKS